jgi:putative transposase
MGAEILMGYVSKDYVLLFVSAPPTISVSKMIQLIKGKTSRKLLSENKVLMKKFQGRHLWAYGFIVATWGNVIDEGIAKNIELKKWKSEPAITILLSDDFSRLQLSHV